MKKSRFFKICICFLIEILFAISLISCCNGQEDLYRKDISEPNESAAGNESVAIDKKSDTYILNTNSLKIHKTTCGTGKLILSENRKVYKGDIYDLLEDGYTKCGNCFRGEK